MMYSVYWLWNVLHAQSPDKFDISLDRMVAYGILGVALGTIYMIPRGPHKLIYLQIRNGLIDTDLMKPMDFHFYIFTRHWGETVFRLVVLLIPALSVAFLTLGFQPPPSLSNGVLFGISLLLAYLIFFHLCFIVGMIAVITLDIRSIEWAFFGVVRFLGGQMVPIWMFPESFRWIVELLPFPYIYYIPLSLYTAGFGPERALKAITGQAVWAGILIIVSRFFWHHIHTRLIVQGG